MTVNLLPLSILVLLAASAPTAQRAVGATLGGEVERSPAASGGTRIQLRGTRITCSNEPLYVLDGLVVGGPGDDQNRRLNQLGAGDILSIRVLRAAEATARFGSAAQNGVVEITTTHADTALPEPAVAAFPNPVLSGRPVTIPSAPGGLRVIRVTDGVGRRIASVPVSASGVAIPTDGFAPGVYWVRLIGDTESTVQFTVQ